jgi:decaprenyl-phosphate phosphoribosyltransferase
LSANGNLRHYISIARPDYWVKHVFILPGILAALILAPQLQELGTVIFKCLVGLLSACLISSANYVINEWLDAESDRNHPEKMNRPGAAGLLKAHWVYLEYSGLVVIGMALAYFVNHIFLLASITLLVSGIVYNVRPIRSKDRVYVDVISEAVNNPIRLMLGWFMISSNSIPPLSLVASYWAGGAFLMSAKRLSEYSFIVAREGAEAAGLYRRSFAYYSTESLTISCFVYALTSSFGMAVFLVKYRAELIFTFPVIIVLFNYYLYLAMQPFSIVQKPEALHKDWRLIVIVVTLMASLTLFSFIDIPLAERLIQSRFIGLHLD